MKLKKIKIVGFKDKNRAVEVQLSNNNCSIIHGNNGVGKTTLLEILSAIFNRDIKTLQINKVSKIELTFENNQNVEIDMSIQNCFLELDKLQIDFLGIGLERGVKEDRKVFSPEQIEDILEIYTDSLETSLEKNEIKHISKFLSIAFKEVKMTIQEENKNKKMKEKNILLSESIEIDYIQYKLQEILKNNKHELFLTLEKIFMDEIDKKLWNNLIEEKVESKIEKSEKILEKLRKYNFQNDIIEKLKLRIIDNNIETNLFLNNLYLKIEKVMKNSKNKTIETLILEINKFLLNKKIQIEDEKILVKIENEKHSLRELSSGERHLVTFVCIIYLYGKNKDIILIDEPELSLNIEWQEDLLSTFERILPNVQFIVASHSPGIIGGEYSRLVELKNEY